MDVSEQKDIVITNELDNFMMVVELDYGSSVKSNM